MGVLAVFSLVLACAGVLAFIVGHFWEGTADFFGYFTTRDLKEHLANKIMLGGGLAALAGFGLMYLIFK